MKFYLSRILFVTITVFTYDVAFGVQSLQSGNQVFSSTTAQIDSCVKSRSTNSPVDYNSNSSYQIESSVDIHNTSKWLQRKRKNDKKKLLVNDDKVNLQLLELLNEKKFEAISKEQLLDRIGTLSKSIFVSPEDKPHLIREETSIYDYVSYITGTTMPTFSKKVEGSEETILLPNFEYCLPLGMGFLQTATCALLLRNTIVDNKIKWLINNKKICTFDINSIAPINLNSIISRLSNLISEFYSSFSQKFQRDCFLITKTLNSNSDLYNYKLSLERIKEICVSININNKSSMYNYVRLCLNNEGKWCFLQKKLNSWIFDIAKYVIDYSNMLRLEIVKKINDNVQSEHVNTILLMPKKQNISNNKEYEKKDADKGQALNNSFFAELNNSFSPKMFDEIFPYN